MKNKAIGFVLVFLSLIGIVSFQNCSQGFAAKQVDQAIAASSQTSTSAAAFDEVHVSGSLSGVEVGQCSTALTVEIRSGGRAVPAAVDLAVTISDLSQNEIFIDGSCQQPATNVVVPKNATSAAFFVKPQTASHRDIVAFAGSVQSAPFTLYSYKRHLLSFDRAANTDGYLAYQGRIIGGLDLTAPGFAASEAPFSSAQAIAGLMAGEDVRSILGPSVVVTNTRVLVGGKTIVNHAVEDAAIYRHFLCVLDNQMVTCFDINSSQPDATSVEISVPTSASLRSLSTSAYTFCVNTSDKIFCSLGASDPASIQLEEISQLPSGSSRMKVAANAVCAIVSGSVMCVPLTLSAGQAPIYTNPPVKVSGSAVIDDLIGGASGGFATLYARAHDGSSYYLNALTADPAPLANGLQLQEAYGLYIRQPDFVNNVTGCGRQDNKVFCWNSDLVPYQMTYFSL